MVRKIALSNLPKLRRLVVVAFLGLCSSVATASEKNYGDIVVSEVVSVYDADTFRVNISGWPALIGESMPIRANGFDAPEIRGKCASEKELAQEARALTVRTLKNADVVKLRNIKRGKYFRIIADVFVDDVALKDIHLNAGTARPYDGGKRQGWCEDQ